MRESSSALTQEDSERQIWTAMGIRAVKSPATPTRCRASVSHPSRRGEDAAPQDEVGKLSKMARPSW
jgi:hypothetical protein